ncbi:prefoldin subunit 4 isoform X3 [Pipistrellus kuhlii]|uniref:prefoldin subunit 4 isoform X3 n=1 Tax=Pipistrellus kuhlii TaxID=59472 RepID=UPI00174F5D23|nr:prefoldin subunit 4 isoform X3 [Pipistrellus kuhlii]
MDLMPLVIRDQAAEDVNVTFEDQQKINKFARNTSRITELKEEIDVKKKQLQNLEDACEDIMLADDDCLMIPYQIGDVFISHSQEETQEMLEEAKFHSYFMGGWRGSGRSHACLAEVATMFM